SVITDAGPIIDTVTIVIADENCGNVDGSITGIVASGIGLTYEWNGIPATGTDTFGLAAGSYTLTVTDGTGCTVSEGPFVVVNLGAPTINTSAMALIDETCSGVNGSITGLTVS